MIEYSPQEMSLVRWCDRREVEKKILPEYYKGINSHKKMYEIRKDDDNIQPGDILVLREWDGEKYTGHMTRREVTSVLRDAEEYGLMPGYCILSLQVGGWDYLAPAKVSYWQDKDKRLIPLDEDGYVSASFNQSVYCANCGESPTASDEYAVIGKYCPNCGAKMLSKE